MESASSLDMGDANEDSGRRGSRDHYRPALDRSAIVCEIEDTLAQRTCHQAGTRASTVLIGSSQPRLGLATLPSRETTGKALQRRIASLVPRTSAGRATFRLARHYIAASTVWFAALAPVLSLAIIAQRLSPIVTPWLYSGDFIKHEDLQPMVTHYIGLEMGFRCAHRWSPKHLLTLDIHLPPLFS